MSPFLTIAERNHRRWIYAQSYIFVLIIPITVFVSWFQEATNFVIISYAFSAIIANLSVGEYVGLLKHDFSASHSSDKRDIFVRYASGRALRVFYLSSIAIVGIYHYIIPSPRLMLRVYPPLLIMITYFILMALNHRLYKTHFLPSWHYQARIIAYTIVILSLGAAAFMVGQEEFQKVAQLQNQKNLQNIKK